MAGNGSTADEQELEEALRLSMIVDDNTTSGTGSHQEQITAVTINASSLAEMGSKVLGMGAIAAE